MLSLQRDSCFVLSVIIITMLDTNFSPRRLSPTARHCSANVKRTLVSWMSRSNTVNVAYTCPFLCTPWPCHQVPANQSGELQDLLLETDQFHVEPGPHKDCISLCDNSSAHCNSRGYEMQESCSRPFHSFIFAPMCAHEHDHVPA